jgi:hypothetical protein
MDKKNLQKLEYFKYILQKGQPDVFIFTPWRENTTLYFCTYLLPLV